MHPGQLRSHTAFLLYILTVPPAPYSRLPLLINHCLGEKLNVRLSAFPDQYSRQLLEKSDFHTHLRRMKFNAPACASTVLIRTLAVVFNTGPQVVKGDPRCALYLPDTSRCDVTLKDNPQFLILLPPFPKCWDHRHVLACLV